MPCNHKPEVQTLKFIDRDGERQKYMMKCPLCLKVGHIRNSEEDARVAWDEQTKATKPPVAVTAA